MEDDDWIFLGGGAGSGSDSDSASEDGSDSDSGFTIVRWGRKGGDAGCSVVADVAVPHPTPPGALYSFKVVSYSEAFSASSSSEDGGSGGGREQQQQPPGCSDEATAGEAIIIQGTVSTDVYTVTWEEGCESDQVGEHDATGSSVEAPSVAAPTVSCPETTAPAALYGEAHSELASGMDQGGAEEAVEDDEDSESCEEEDDDDDDDDMENASEDEDDTDSSSEEDMDCSSEDEDEDTFSSSEQEDTESFSEEAYSETCSVDDDDMDTDSSGSDMDADSSGMEDYDCLESDEENDIDDVAENSNRAIFDMLFPRAKPRHANMDDDYKDESEHGNIDDYEQEEDVSLFDMLLPRDHAIDDDIDIDSSDTEDDWLESDEEDDIVHVADNGNQDIIDMLLAMATALGANIDDYEDESEHGYVDYEEEEEEQDGFLIDMLFHRDYAINDIDDSSDGEDEAATATAACGHNAEPRHGTRRPEFSGRAARGYDDIDTDSDTEECDDEAVAADVNGTTLYVLPRATTSGGGGESQCWGFACQSQTERQALWEHLRRVLAAEALESSGRQQQQKRSYDDVDDTCDLPGAAAPGGGPAGSCARTPEAQFTARDTERELAMEEATRREAAQRELDRALATEAAAAAEALVRRCCGAVPPPGGRLLAASRPT